jgi:ribosome-binding protein aMBF1 (putative translation factor)
MLVEHNRGTMTSKAPVAQDIASPVGDSFDDYVSGVEADLDSASRQALDALRAHYDLASQLMTLRKRNKLTQVDLALRAGVHQSVISRVERGATNTSQDSLERIAQVFGVQLGFIDTEGRPVA